MTFASFCPNCGTAQLPGSEFCVECGYAQRVEMASPQPAPPEPHRSASPAVPPPGAPTPVPTPAPAIVAAAAPNAAPPAFSLMQMIGAVIGVSIGFGALAVAITLIMSRGERDPNIDGGPTTSSMQVVEVDNIRAEVPNAWDVVTRARDTVRVNDPRTRAMSLRSALLPASLALDEIQARFLDRTRDQSPDARLCAGPETAALPGGPRDGQYFVICSTFVPQGGGPAVRFADAYYVAIWSGVTVSVMQLTAVPGELEAFATDVRGLPPPVWKLHR